MEVKRDVQELADSLGVTIFTADIIYHLFDKFTQYRDELLKKKQEEFKHVAVFPCKLKIMPQYVFNSRDPIVMGVVVQNGFLKEGTPICVPSKDVSRSFLPASFGTLAFWGFEFKQCFMSVHTREMDFKFRIYSQYIKVHPCVCVCVSLSLYICVYIYIYVYTPSISVRHASLN